MDDGSWLSTRTAGMHAATSVFCLIFFYATRWSFMFQRYLIF